MNSNIVFFIIVIAAWGIISYYFWFVWRKAKLKNFEETIKLDLKQSLPCPKLQLGKKVICLERDKPVKDAVENMRDPQGQAKRKSDPKSGIGSVVIVDKPLQDDVLKSSNILSEVHTALISFTNASFSVRTFGSELGEPNFIAMVILSPVERSISISRRGGLGERSRAMDNKLLVVFPIAETTTATSIC